MLKTAVNHIIIAGLAWSVASKQCAAGSEIVEEVTNRCLLRGDNEAHCIHTSSLNMSICTVLLSTSIVLFGTWFPLYQTVNHRIETMC